MSFDAKKLYALLPAIHRLRDANGLGALTPNPTPGALEDFMKVLAGQVGVLEEELAQLYENHFAETAADWALPYLGDLIGIRDLGGTGQAGKFAPRAEVANTIGYRRRKGTAAMLEQLARDISGQPAAAVEFWQRLATTQHLNHVRKGNIVWASLRSARQLEFIGTPFEQATRTVEVRRIEPALGRWNIPNVGLFLWRLRARTHSRTPLTSAGFPDGRHFRLHPLGLDVALCARPESETEISHLAEPKNVPVVLTRRLLAEAGEKDPVPAPPGQFHPAKQWYGGESVDGEPSVLLWKVRAGQWESISRLEIIVCDLHDVHQNDDPTKPIVHWAHTDRAPANIFILLDPLRGRVVFPSAPPDPVFASFSTLFPADLGGGEYARTASFDLADDATVMPVAQQLLNIPPTGPAPMATLTLALQSLPVGDTVIEVLDSGNYSEASLAVDATDRYVEFRASDERWPVLTLTQPLKATGDEDGVVTINGFQLIGSAGIETGGTLGTLRLRHCTVMPGLQIGPNGRLDVSSVRPAAVRLLSGSTQVEFENCILGPIRAAQNVSVHLKNCIVDAGSLTAYALARTQTGEPGGVWQIENCTIIGRVSVRELELASNSLFFGQSVEVERRQEGCVRFCWLPDDAQVPRRHKCIPRVDQDDQGNDVIINCRPQFASRRFGDADYCLLSRLCPDALRRGADDESEIGVYHDLFVAAREDHLRARLREYLRFGLEAGIFYESSI